MIKLDNPSLTLYAYQLISDAHHEQRPEAEQFWQILADCGTPLDLPELNQLPQQLIPVADRQHDIPLFSEVSRFYQNDRLTVGITPVRLHDLYAVDFTVSQPSQQLDTLHQLNPKGCLLPSAIQNKHSEAVKLGQTLLFYAQPSDPSQIDETLAKQCVHKLWQDSPETPPDFYLNGSGQLFGSRYFEYYAQSNDPDAPPLQLIVWFGEHEATLTLAGETTWQFIKLFSYRHKIEFVTDKAQRNYNAARTLYRELEQQNEAFSELNTKHKQDHLAQLESMLKALPKQAMTYNNIMRSLNDHKHTLEANITNYQNTLKDITARVAAYKIANEDVTSLQAFHDNAVAIKQKQIALYIGYLSPAQSLYQELTQNIQGLLQINTLKHEFDKQERLERLVVFIASTLESAAISVKVDYDHTFASILLGDAYKPIKALIGDHFTGIFTHISIGLVFGAVAYGILIAYQRFKKH